MCSVERATLDHVLKNNNHVLRSAVGKTHDLRSDL